MSAAEAGADTVYRVPAAFRRADGTPRFEMRIPKSAMDDAGVRVLAVEESRLGGYEYPSRAFVDAHLEPGDAFLDVGAHWGVFSLQAATRHPGRVPVVAVEPHPLNVQHLLAAVAGNGLAETVEIVAAAAGERTGTAPLVFNTTMGHSLFGLGHPAGAPRLGSLTVPMLPLDSLVAEREPLAGRRLIVKIDAEGYEPEVLAGARAVLESGRVAVLIWEHGRAFFEGERRQAMLEMAARLEARGFRHYRFPHPTLGGALVPFAPTLESFNVFALAPGVERRPAYLKPDPAPIRLPTPCRAPADAEARARVTETLIERQATDASRWADVEALAEGAEARARLAAAEIAPGSSVLDLGAGAMALRAALPAGCGYAPADLVQFDPATHVVDLDAGDFPVGLYDVVVMLDVVEFLHRPEPALAAAGAAAPRLVVGYRPADDGDVAARRRQGFVNDFTEEAFAALLGRAGWRVARRTDGAGLRLYVCERG